MQFRRVLFRSLSITAVSQNPISRKRAHVPASPSRTQTRPRSPFGSSVSLIREGSAVVFVGCIGNETLALWCLLVQMNETQFHLSRKGIFKPSGNASYARSEEHTSELQSFRHL